MASRWQIVLGLSAASVVVATPLLYSSHRHAHMRNIRVVEEGVLYRSAQLSPEGLDRIIREKAIKTVVTLRAARKKGEPDPDAWEEAFCTTRGLRHVRIPPRVWGASESGEIPAEETIAEFLAVMDDKKNYPVLVHCFAGIHRTGTMCAIFRMEFNHWPNYQAVEEMRLCGFDPLDMQEHIAGYLMQYRPRDKQ